MTGWVSRRHVSRTRAGWALLAAAALLVVGGLAVDVASPDRELGDFVRLAEPPDCTVRSGDRTVELDQHEVERAAMVVAPVVRRGAGAAAATSAVARAVPVSAADARAVAAALTGRVPAALACAHGGADTAESDRLGARGLTRRAATVRRDLLAGFGPLRLGGYAPGGVSTGHMANSAHYDGRAIDVFFRPANGRNKARGWAVAQYLVAHADRLEIETVIFDGRIWTARRAGEGWRDYRVDTTGRSRYATRVLEHREHVHVDVAD